MPDFCSAFSGMASDRMLTDSELVRGIRFMVAAEYEAVQLYVQLAESTTNTLAKNVLMDIANEERVHAGEFLRLLKELAPDEEEMYRQGAEEVESEFLGAAGGEAPTEGPSGESATGDGSLGIGSLRG